MNITQLNCEIPNKKEPMLKQAIGSLGVETISL
ncbi:hypothetical protein AAEX37_02195 [Oligella sp. MSHR50489EDL]